MAEGADKLGALARRFELGFKLGEGGMGIVHRAFDRTLGKHVALKRMREMGAAQAMRLKAEFRARSALQHRNLVQLYELVLDGDDCFFTMELVDGTDLDSWVRQGPTREANGSAAAAASIDMDIDDDGASTTRVERTQGTVPPRARSEASRPVKPALDADGIVRLREAIVELCRGLSALHDGGIVHQDVKPANIRVTREGRVVLLDFGLAGSPGNERPGSSSPVVAGTLSYMAPEQVNAETITPAADMYAVGGILYELLAGQSAFVGSPLLVRMTKAARARAPSIASETPDDVLAELAMSLLSPQPEDRPTAREVLARLAREGTQASGAPTFGLPVPGGFFGRQSEMAALEGALQRVAREKAPVAVVVEGPSSIGKSTLLRQFVADLRRKDPTALVIGSRCHPQETLPFKALDAAMDAIAEGAPMLPDLGAVPPALAQAAVRLFPVLSSIPGFEHPTESITPPDDPELRAQGFDGLRAMFELLATRGPLVLVVDDAQWDDADSLALLEAVLRPRGAPPMLLLLSVRTESRESAIVKRLLDPRLLVPVVRLRLGALGNDDIASIAAVFLGEGDARIRRVVTQSEGNPFLACELARYATAAAPTATLRDVDVRGLMSARLGDLGATERALVDVASIAVRPLPTAWAIEAAHLSPSAHTAVLALRDAFLVRQDASAAGETIAPYHDRIAEATQQLLSDEARRAVHRSLAETLERHAPDDADALCVHWEGARETSRAADCARRAAEKAAATLAFERAAQLWEKAIALGAVGTDRAELMERAAAAHANAGNAPDAARRYLDASNALGDDVRDQRVRRLKRLAAEQYVKSGYVKRGWEVMSAVLAAAGIAQPASPGRATVEALGRRLRFLARKVDIDAIGDRRIPEAERARLEILWTASTSMSMVNVTLSDAFRTMHLGRILDVGDASSIARALAYEVALEAHVGGRLFDWHAGRLLGHARRLVAKTDDPYDQAWLELGVANQAFCAGRFADAAAACRRSDRILREQCRGVAWEISTVAAFLLTSLAMLGDLHALRESAERLIADAERHGDLFGLAEGLSGECILAWWSAGGADDALARASAAVARQGGDAERWPEKTYRRGQLTELMATVHLRLLSGDPWPAWGMMLAHWDGLKSALIPSLQFYRSWVRHGRARVALAAAEKGDTRGGFDRARLLADAEAMSRHIRKDTRPFGAPWAALVEGALAHAAGNRSGACTSLEAALAGFSGAGMELYREVTRWRLGEMSRSSEQRQIAEAWLRRQGVPDPRALVGALAPGYSEGGRAS